MIYIPPLTPAPTGRMKRILITGNAGYIGSHVMQRLQQSAQYEIHGLDLVMPPQPCHRQWQRDIRDPDQMPNLEFDTVIHLAALVSVAASMQDPEAYYQTNVLGTQNLLTHVRCRNFVFASTGSIGAGLNPYAASKHQAEQLVQQHCERNNITWSTFRFYNVLGSLGFVPSNSQGLWHNLLEATRTGQFDILGTDYDTPDGTALRDYVHVGDIVQALEQAISDPAQGTEYLGTGQARSVLEIVQLFQTVNQVEFVTRALPRRSGDPARCVLDQPSRYFAHHYTAADLVRL